MAYTSLQFVGYAIDTLREQDPPTFVSLDDALLDIEARCQLLLRALNTARDYIPRPSPPPRPGEMLTVFLLPAFFFRSKQGAYGMDETLEAIARLQQIAAGPQWTDWVIGFGTIAGILSGGSAGQRTISFALIQQGGLGAQSTFGSRIVMKEHTSAIDFIDQSSTPAALLNDVHLLKPISVPELEHPRFAYDGAGIFELCGLTWAVQIPADNAQETGGQSLQSPQWPGDTEVQVQLIPCCGHYRHNVVAEHGGYVFSAQGQLGAWSWLNRVIDPARTAPVNPAGWYGLDNSDIVLTNVSPARHVAIDQLYHSNGPNLLVIYAPVEVPPARKVQGRVTPLAWQASADYNFIFHLIGATALVEVNSSKIDFFGFKYSLPLVAARQDINDHLVIIEIKLIAGTGGFDAAVWCKIVVPDFIFEGIALQFNNMMTADKPPQTIWERDR
jgi:hypothetical protein